jgi:alpha-galactosidase
MATRKHFLWGIALLCLGLIIASSVTAAGPVGAQPAQPSMTLAPTPPMGWNSWDCYGPTVTEGQVKAQADFMAKHLAQHGWQYIVVDIQWYEPTSGAHGYHPLAKLVMDPYGRLMPAPNRFPSAADGKGFKPLADYVHSLGLRFGIHIMRGIPRQAVDQDTPILGTYYHAQDIADKTNLCKWLTDMYGVDTTKPGGQAYYDSILSLYAQWGVDYIKADDMSSPFQGPEIKALHRAIVNSGRPIVLSLSPGPAPLDREKELAANAQLWRISGDFWDRWRDLRNQFDLCKIWAAYSGPGHWPDADMLPLGRIGIKAEVGNPRQTNFTRDEQFTLMTLWSIFRSPLMMGGDLPSLDAFALSLLTNDEVLAVNQKSSGGRELFRRGDQIAWAADIPGTRDRYIALFNLGEQPAQVQVLWKEIGLDKTCAVRDLWQQRNLGNLEDKPSMTVNPHGARLFRVSPRP